MVAGASDTGEARDLRMRLLWAFAPFAIVATASVLIAACAADSGERERVGSTSDGLTQCVNGGPTLEGVDVFDGQGTIDWNAAKSSGIAFAIIKATQGTYNKQTTFAANWSKTKAAGVYRSAYHFFDPTEDGVAQANHFLQVVGPLSPGDLPPMLDVECPDGDPNCLYAGGAGTASASAIRQRMTDWLRTVESATGRKPIVYTFGAYFSSNGVDTTGLAQYPLFIAYPTAATCFNVPTPWTRAAMWQWTWHGTVPGITGEVDRDRFLGTLADLAALAGNVATGPGSASPAHVNGNDVLSVVTWPDGHGDVFGVTKGGQSVHVASQKATETWGAGATLGSGVCGGAAAMWPDGHGEIFDPTATGGTQNALSQGGAFRAFGDFGRGGSALSRLSTVVFPDGHLDVFALGDDHAIWRNKWNAGKSQWEGWSSLGGHVVTGAAPLVWADGHVEIYATDAAGVAWHNWTIASGWAGFASLGGSLTSRPSPVRWPDGRVEIFARGADARLQHATFNAGAWTPFTVLDGNVQIAGEPSAVMVPAPGGAAPQVFARDIGGLAVRIAWTGAAWSAWAPLGQTLASSPLAWVRGGAVEVFGVDAQNNLVTTALTSAGSDAGALPTWSAIAAGLDPCVLEANAGGGDTDAGRPHGDVPPPMAPPSGDTSGCLCASGAGARVTRTADALASFAALFLTGIALRARSIRRARRRTVR